MNLTVVPLFRVLRIVEYTLLESRVYQLIGTGWTTVTCRKGGIGGGGPWYPLDLYMEVGVQSTKRYWKKPTNEAMGRGHPIKESHRSWPRESTSLYTSLVGDVNITPAAFTSYGLFLVPNLSWVDLTVQIRFCFFPCATHRWLNWRTVCWPWTET